MNIIDSEKTCPIIGFHVHSVDTFWRFELSDVCGRKLVAQFPCKDWWLWRRFLLKAVLKDRFHLDLFPKRKPNARA